MSPYRGPINHSLILGFLLVYKNIALLVKYSCGSKYPTINPRVEI